MMDERPCDSCGDVMLAESIANDTRYIELVLPTGNKDEFHARSYELCTECRRKIADWIDECDESEVRVETTGLDYTIEELVHTSVETRQLAERLAKFGNVDVR